MDDCKNCEYLQKCRDVEKVACPWEEVQEGKRLEEIYPFLFIEGRAGK